MSRIDKQSQEADPLLSMPTDVGVGIQSPPLAARLRLPIGTMMRGVGGRSALMMTNMLVLLVTSRVMAPDEFGRFAIAQMTVDLAAAASYAFVGIPMLQRNRLRSEDYRNAFTLLLIIGLAAGTLLNVLAGAIEQWLRMPGLEPLLRLAGILIPIRCASSFFMAALQRQSKVDQIIWAQTKSQIIAALGVTLILAAFGLGAWSLLLGLSAATVLELIWCVRAARIRPGIGMTRRTSNFARDGVAPLVNRLLAFASDWTDRLLIGATFGASQLGIYTRASSLVLIPTNLIALPVQNTLLSWFSRIKANTSRVTDVLGNAVAILGLLLVPTTIGLWLASPLLVGALLGEEWSAAIPIAQVLFIGTMARMAAAPFESAALTMGYTWGAMRRQLTSVAVLMIGLAVGVGQSVIWVAVAVAASRVVYYVMTMRFVVITFGKSWGPVAAAHAKSLVLSGLGLIAAFGTTALVQLPWVIANQLVMVASYVLGCGLVLLFGPKWLVAPAGPMAFGFVAGMGKRLFARAA